MTATGETERREKLIEGAARWFARERAGGLSRAERSELETWLGASPEHSQAYLRVVDLWDAADSVRLHADVLTVREATLRRYPASARGRRPSRLIYGLSAAAAAAAVIALMVYTQADSHVFQTGVGQTATIALIDGSRLTLDTDTTVLTHISGASRQIVLQKGRAFFKVAKDHSRPFVVQAEGRQVVATGTEFEVTAEDRRFEVLLVQGHVQVRQPSKRPGLGGGKTVTAELDPGTRLVGIADGPWTLSRATGTDELSWMQGELFFDNKPLGEIVTEMNRYSRRKIVVSDPAVASRMVYGAFMAGDVDQFVRALVDYRIARVQSQTASAVTIAAP